MTMFQRLTTSFQNAFIFRRLWKQASPERRKLANRCGTVAGLVGFGFVLSPFAFLLPYEAYLQVFGERSPQSLSELVFLGWGLGGLGASVGLLAKRATKTYLIKNWEHVVKQVLSGDVAFIRREIAARITFSTYMRFCSILIVSMWPLIHFPVWWEKYSLYYGKSEKEINRRNEVLALDMDLLQIEDKEVMDKKEVSKTIEGKLDLKIVDLVQKHLDETFGFGVSTPTAEFLNSIYRSEESIPNWRNDFIGLLEKDFLESDVVKEMLLRRAVVQVLLVSVREACGVKYGYVFETEDMAPELKAMSRLLRELDSEQWDLKNKLKTICPIRSEDFALDSNDLNVLLQRKFQQEMRTGN